MKNAHSEIVDREEFGAKVFIIKTDTPHSIIHRDKKLHFQETTDESDEIKDIKPELRVEYCGFSVLPRAVCVVLTRKPASSQAADERNETTPIANWFIKNQKLAFEENDARGPNFR